MCMFKINKIQAQVVLLERKKLKFEMYLKETQAASPKNPEKEAEIERAIRKVDEQIKTWKEKVEMVKNQAARQMPRPPMTDDLGGPYV